MSKVFKKHDRYWSEIAVFGDYMPWGVHRANGGDRSNYPEHSGKILDLKDGKDVGIDYCAALVQPELNDNIAIVTVPSHDPAKTTSGLKSLAAILAKDGNRVDASSCLVRTKKINKLAGGGDRSKEVHQKSIVAANVELLKDRDVLLIDDVTKTGNSLEACRDILLKAGARSVEMATIGKT